MKNMEKRICIIIFSIACLICRSFSQELNNDGRQTGITDSIHRLLKSDKGDTTHLIHLCGLSLEYQLIGNYRDGILYGNKTISAADAMLAKPAISDLEKFTINTYKAKAYTIIGNIYRFQNNYKNAIKYFTSALETKQGIGDKKGMASSYNSLGMIYADQGSYVEALKNYFISLKIKEAIGDKKGISNCYNNIGLVYYYLGNYGEALKNHEAALRIRKEIKDVQGIAYSYNNIGNVYYELKNYTESLKSNLSSLKIMEENGDQDGVANSYNNIAGNYYSQGILEKEPMIRKEKLELALKNFKASLEIRERTLNNMGIAASCGNIAGVLVKQNKYTEAENYFMKAKDLSLKIGYKELLREIHIGLAELDSLKGDFKGAYENHVLYVAYKDSLDNEETQKQTLQNQLAYDFEKKEAIAAAEHRKELENQRALAAEKSRKQNVITGAVFFGLLMVVIFSGFILRSLNLTRRQKNIIESQKFEVEQQKHLVEEKQKEIIDSITYAKRLQQAILPSEEELKTQLPDSFVLYQPKDIVAGDFYWMHVAGDNLFIAAADSTGHGVPGAMVSVVCCNALNRAVDEFKLTDPGKILDKTRMLVLETFAKSGEEIKDGMDISLLCINKSVSQITWSGANNQLWYIQNRIFTEIKANKQPIGKTDDPKPFTTHFIEMNAGDIFYLITDGYADQFGGPKGKKFKCKTLEEKLISISRLSLQEQQEILMDVFNNWRGEQEQVDDVTIIGIKI